VLPPLVEVPPLGEPFGVNYVAEAARGFVRGQDSDPVQFSIDFLALASWCAMIERLHKAGKNHSGAIRDQGGDLAGPIDEKHAR
jgi:hypothetical protein